MQNTINIEICSEFLNKKENKILELLLVHNNDTFYFPKIDSNLYLNPISFYQLDSTYNESTNQNVTILLKNSKYIYEIEFAMPIIVYNEKIEICIFKEKKGLLGRVDHSCCSQMLLPKRRKY